MMSVTNTNIRMGPGVYLSLKEISDKTGISIGGWANFFVVTGITTNWKEIFTALSPEIKTALASDFLSVLGDLFKMVGLEAIKNTSIADLYQKLLKPEKNPLVS